MAALETTTHATTPSFDTDPSISRFLVPSQTWLSDLGNTNHAGTVHNDASSTPYGYIAVGALTFDRTGRILLIQRASSDSIPNLWEIPGGACDDEDPTILHAVARELFEEAGLKATKIGLQVGLGQGYTFLTSTKKVVCKFSFLAEVEIGGEVDEKGWLKVKLDPEEHQNYVWATREECKAEKVGDLKIPFTHPEQKKMVLDAFGAWMSVYAAKQADLITGSDS